VVTNIVRLAGAATMLILGGFLIVMFRRERTGSPTRNALSGVGVAESHGSNKGTGRA